MKKVNWRFVSIGSIKRKQGKSVYTKSNEQAFTLIELVVSLSVFMIITAVLLSLYPVFLTKQSSPYTDEPVMLFMFQFQKALRSAEQYWTDSDGRRLVMEMAVDGTVQTETFIVHNNRIVRQVEGRGYDVYLEEVTSASFTIVNQGVVISVRRTDGREYERRLGSITGTGDDDEE
ncbi:prepilin-type N-terminal cleavage/methylation domain-containing protein [Bacillus sp. H-16]|nr:competence type IV pilus minor pilin ComGF [Alteribacter salitolerans]MBM7097316.1 prepilin-type N-terminal cleavage/methylation domain-containing protein [Alteribacter salitolerans]